MSSPAADLHMALLSTGLVQPTDVKGKGGRLEALCRLVPGQEKAWVAVMADLLEAAEYAGFNLHLCRRYVRREKAMVFGYHIGVETTSAKLMKSAVEVVVEVLRKAKPSLTAVAAPPPSHKAPVASARPPGPPGGGKMYGSRPEGHDPSVKVIEQKTDSEGRDIIVEEMPLPHVYKDLNRPDPAKGRAARGARPLSTNAR